MAKKPEQDQEQEYNFMEHLNRIKVEKVAKLNILPTFKVNYDQKNKVSDIYNVIVLSLPKPTDFADGNTYLTMLLEMNQVVYQFNCNAESFQFQLAVLIEKHFEGVIKDLITHEIQISKTMAKIDTDNFKGKAEVYQISLIK